MYGVDSISPQLSMMKYNYLVLYVYIRIINSILVLVVVTKEGSSFNSLLVLIVTSTSPSEYKIKYGKT